MYWFKIFVPTLSSKKTGVIVAMGLAFMAMLSACKPDIKETSSSLKYFDLKGYFKADSARLTQKHPLVTKTVKHNGAGQTKKVYVDNWAREFEPFVTSDINKPAWRQSYTVQSGKGLTIYSALTPDLKTREIVIKLIAGKVKWILIHNHTKNMLFENTEELTYFPDSLYSIAKWQHVRLMGTNQYAAKGIFSDVLPH